jgi:hypothetical protein
MARFGELEALWQSHASAPGPSVGDLMRDLRRKHQTIYIVKAVAVAVLAAVMLFVVHQFVVAMAGGLLVISGAALTLTVDWRAHHALARLEFTAPVSSFASEATRMLRRLERPLPVQYLALLFDPFAGLNLIEMAMLHGVSWQGRRRPSGTLAAGGRDRVGRAPGSRPPVPAGDAPPHSTTGNVPGGVEGKSGCCCWLLC